MTLLSEGNKYNVEKYSLPVHVSNGMKIINSAP
jgi:hypothetical protein